MASPGAVGLENWEDATEAITRDVQNPSPQVETTDDKLVRTLITNLWAVGPVYNGEKRDKVNRIPIWVQSDFLIYIDASLHMVRKQGTFAAPEEDPGVPTKRLKLDGSCRRDTTTS